MNREQTLTVSKWKYQRHSPRANRPIEPANLGLVRSVMYTQETRYACRRVISMASERVIAMNRQILREEYVTTSKGLI